MIDILVKFTCISPIIQMSRYAHVHTIPPIQRNPPPTIQRNPPIQKILIKPLGSILVLFTPAFLPSLSPFPYFSHFSLPFLFFPSPFFDFLPLMFRPFDSLPPQGGRVIEKYTGLYKTIPSIKKRCFLITKMIYNGDLVIFWKIMFF